MIIKIWLLAKNFNLEIRSPGLVRGNDYNSNSYVNLIPVDIYFQSEFSETKFRAIYVEMSMLFHEYYATSPKLRLLQTDRKK